MGAKWSSDGSSWYRRVAESDLKSHSVFEIHLIRDHRFINGKQGLSNPKPTWIGPPPTPGKRARRSALRVTSRANEKLGSLAG